MIDGPRVWLCGFDSLFISALGGGFYVPDVSNSFRHVVLVYTVKASDRKGFGRWLIIRRVQIEGSSSRQTFVRLR